MNKNELLFIVLLLVFPNLLLAQKTHYYKLVKIVRNNENIKSVSGGQFITFINDICYESNCKGIGVGHGTLTKNKGYSSDNIIIYLGNSYWGKNTTFKFSADFITLNAITESGDLYLYKQSTPPSGVTTCSLIRKKSTPSNGNSGGYTAPIQPMQPTYGGGNNSGLYNQGSGGTYSSSEAQNSSRQNNRKWNDCPLCHGSGRIVHNTYTATFGTTDYEVYCAECGRNWMKSTGHSHITCTQCHGRKGWWSE